MYDCIVIGSGPSGLMASIMASKNNKVLLIEKNNFIGKKLSITGGGRCNITNLQDNIDFINNISINKKFLYSSINNFGPKKIYNYFNHLGVKLKIEENNKVFPLSNNANDIVDVLVKELNKNKIAISLNTNVVDINIKDELKEVITNRGIYYAKNIVVATGGKSYSSTGSTGDGYKWANKLNQPLTNLYPVETSLITQETKFLAGITLENVIIKFNKMRINDSILFTHKGISGPAIFQISEHVFHEIHKNGYAEIYIDLLPKYNVDQLLSELNNVSQKKELKTFVKEFLPIRIVDYLLKRVNIDGTMKLAAISNKNKNILIDEIKNHKLIIKKTMDLEHAIVTGGGINIKYINPKTMESTINKGIYFVGEVLDVHGPIGGYNITISLSTGYTAGVSLKASKE